MNGDERARFATLQSFGFGRLFDAARDSVIVADDRGVILLWNASATELFGWTADEAVGQPVAIIVPERLRPLHHAGMARFGKTGHGPLLDERRTVELPAVRRDGSEIVVELMLTPFEEPRRMVMAIVRDVTDRARLRASLERERDELRQANRALEAFSFLVSHDLKEPVRALHGYLGLAEDGEASPDVKLAVGRAKEATVRLETLMRGLLEWGQVARRPVERVPVDVAEVARGQEVVAQYANLASERKATVEIDTQGIRVLATVPLLAQIVGNSLVNAIKHNTDPAPHVRVVARPADDGLVEVGVEDNGPGFPEGILAWYHPARKEELPTVKGGFGLLISQRAAERLGSRLEITNRPAGGGRVVVKLPRAG